MYTMSAYNGDPGKVWNYALSPDSKIVDHINISAFTHDQYNLHVDGPNGFYRGFAGSLEDPGLQVHCQYEHKKNSNTGNILLILENLQNKPLSIVLHDNVYTSRDHQSLLLPGKQQTIIIALQKQYGWYDFTVAVKGYATYQRRYAGHVETGKPSKTDPYMGGMI